MYFWSLNQIGRVGWLICLIYVMCVALRLARFNVSSDSEPSWKDNFFEGIPSPAGGVLVLMPLVYSFSEFQIFQLNYDLIVPVLFITISILLVSKVPTYSFKKIKVQRSLTIFLLLGIVFYFGLVLVYTFNALVLSALIYFLIIPISSIHYLKISKKYNIQEDDNDHEDIL